MKEVACIYKIIILQESLKPIQFPFEQKLRVSTSVQNAQKVVFNAIFINDLGNIVLQLSMPRLTCQNLWKDGKASLFYQNLDWMVCNCFPSWNLLISETLSLELFLDFWRLWKILESINDGPYYLLLKPAEMIVLPRPLEQFRTKKCSQITKSAFRKMTSSFEAALHLSKWSKAMCARSTNFSS